MRIEEEVVTETNLPLRIGVKTESRGSALCLTVWIYDGFVSLRCQTPAVSTEDSIPLGFLLKPRDSSRHG